MQIMLREFPDRVRLLPNNETAVACLPSGKLRTPGLMTIKLTFSLTKFARKNLSGYGYLCQNWITNHIPPLKKIVPFSLLLQLYHQHATHRFRCAKGFARNRYCYSFS